MANGYFWRWTHCGVWAHVNATLVRQVRKKHGRPEQPSAGVIDSQSVKTSEGGAQRGAAGRSGAWMCTSTLLAESDISWSTRWV